MQKNNNINDNINDNIEDNINEQVDDIEENEYHDLETEEQVEDEEFEYYHEEDEEEVEENNELDKNELIDANPLVDQNGEVNMMHPLFDDGKIIKAFNQKYLPGLIKEQLRLKELEDKDDLYGLDASNKEKIDELLTHQDDAKKVEDFTKFIHDYLEIKKDIDVEKFFDTINVTLLNHPEKVTGYQDIKSFIEDKRIEEVVQVVNECFEMATGKKVDINLAEYVTKLENNAKATFTYSNFKEEIAEELELNGTSLINQQKDAIKSIVKENKEIQENSKDAKKMQEAFSKMIDNIVSGKTKVPSFENMDYTSEHLGEIGRSLLLNVDITSAQFDYNNIRDMLDSKIDGVKESPKALNKFFECLGVRKNENEKTYHFSETEIDLIKTDSKALRPALSVYQRLNEIHEKRPWYFAISHPNQFWTERSALKTMEKVLKDDFKVAKDELSPYTKEEVKDKNNVTKVKDVLKRPEFGDKIASTLFSFDNPKQYFPVKNSYEIYLENMKNRLNKHQNEIQAEKNKNRKELSNEASKLLKGKTTEEVKEVSSKSTITSDIEVTKEKGK